MSYEADNIAEIRQRLDDNLKWVQDWESASGPTNTDEFHRRRQLIAEDEQFLRDLGDNPL